MQGYESGEELKDRVMDAASRLEESSGAHAFTENDLARELGMKDDASQERQLSIVVNQLVNEGRLMHHPGLSKPLSIGNR